MLRNASVTSLKTVGLAFFLLALLSAQGVRADNSTDADMSDLSDLASAFNITLPASNATATVQGETTFRDQAAQLIAYMISTFGLGGLAVVLIVAFIIWWRCKHLKYKRQEAAFRERAEEVAKQHLQLTSHMP
jgi:hypothetical protein